MAILKIRDCIISAVHWKEIRGHIFIIVAVFGFQNRKQFVLLWANIARINITVDESLSSRSINSDTFSLLNVFMAIASQINDKKITVLSKQ